MLLSIALFLQSLIKFRRPILASLDLPYGMHLSNEAVPIGHEYLMGENNPNDIYIKYIQSLKKINQKL